MGHRDQASAQGMVRGCTGREEQMARVPHQTWGSMVSLGSVFGFRSILSLCCGITKLSPPQLSKLMPLCRSISRPRIAQALQGAKGTGTEESKSARKSYSLCQSLSTEPLGAAKGRSWGSREKRKASSGPAGPRASLVWDPEGPSHRLVRGEGGVTSHEEVEPRCGDERGDEADEVIVHVAGVTQGGGAGRHDGGHLGTGVPCHTSCLGWPPFPRRHCSPKESRGGGSPAD